MVLVVMVAGTPSVSAQRTRIGRPALRPIPRSGAALAQIPVQIAWVAPLKAMVDPNEDPLETAKRELLEETGYPTMSIELIGQGATCSSRISNTTHSFFVRTGDRAPGFVEEPGVHVSSVSTDELHRLVLSGVFGEQTQLGVLAQASARGLLIL